MDSSQNKPAYFHSVFKEITKTVGSFVLYYSGLISLYRTLFPRRKIVILLFHEGKSKHLERCIKHLVKHYKIIPLDEFIEASNNQKAIPKNSIVMTFDDGYKSNYLNVYPLLKKYKIPATIFLTVAMIGTENLFWWNQIEYAVNNSKQKSVRLGTKEWRLNTPNKKRTAIAELIEIIRNTSVDKVDDKLNDLINQLDVDVTEGFHYYPILTWEEVKEMCNTGITFGSHALNHLNLTKISLAGAEEEIEESKLILTNKIGGVVKHFSYPNGMKEDFNEDIKEIIRRAGYSCALTAIEGYNDHNTDLFELKRIPIGEDNNLYSFATIVSGLWGKLYGNY